jgi:N-acetylmuramoyl-L-alanine amidase
MRRRLAGLFLVLAMVGGMAGPATAAPLYEKDVNLDESNRLRDILVAHGIDVVMTRTVDENPALADRAHLGGEGDLLVSVHNNSSGSSAAHGTEVYAQIGNDQSMQLAENILTGVVNRAGTTSRGALTRAGERGDYYSILRNSPVPAVIVEGAFISNPDEAAALASPDFRQRLAEGIADGVLSMVGSAPALGNGPTPTSALLGGLLAAPAGLTAARSGDGVQLSWAPVGLAGGYEIWKDGGLIGTSISSSFSDPSFGGGRHHYEVRAFLGLGDLRIAESPSASVQMASARVVIDPGHGGVDSGAVGDA